jgi:hypothetical protein
VVATVHLSAVLRDRYNRDEAYRRWNPESPTGPTHLSGSSVWPAYQSAGSHTDSAASTVSSTGSSSLRPQAATIRETLG